MNISVRLLTLLASFALGSFAFGADQKADQPKDAKQAADCCKEDKGSCCETGKGDCCKSAKSEKPAPKAPEKK